MLPCSYLIKSLSHQILRILLEIRRTVVVPVAMDGLNSPINEKMSALCMWYPVCLFPTAWRVGGDDGPGETDTMSNAGCK